MTKLKSFENYEVKQRFSGGFTQWKKRYDDGLEAWVCVDDTKCTRALVRSAFIAQERGIENGLCFSKKDAMIFGLKY